MNWLGTIHLLTAIAALISGAVVGFARKGTRSHRRVGWIYFVSMVLLNGTAFFIYGLFDGFGPFHFAAIVSGVTVLLGFIAAFWRWPKKTWVAGHAYWMAWSYVGLCAAAVSEVSTRYLHMNFGLTVGIATLVVVGIGSRIIKRHVPRILRENYGIS